MCHHSIFIFLIMFFKKQMLTYLSELLEEDRSGSSYRVLQPNRRVVDISYWIFQSINMMLYPRGPCKLRKRVLLTASAPAGVMLKIPQGRIFQKDIGYLLRLFHVGLIIVSI